MTATKHDTKGPINNRNCCSLVLTKPPPRRIRPDNEREGDRISRKSGNNGCLQQTQDFGGRAFIHGTGGSFIGGVFR